MARKEKISKERQELIKQFISQNNISTAHDIETALRDMMKDTLQAMLEGELTEQLGHDKYEYSQEQKENYRNGYSNKTVHSTAGDLELKIPRDRNNEFDPIIVEKGSKDISNIEEKIIRMYARGISNREIYQQMQELYGVKISPDMVTAITDKIIPKIKEWQQRPLDNVYPVVFVDATYFYVKTEGCVGKKAVYIILGINSDGYKDVLGFYVSESESSKYWLNIFNELKSRGLQDILILCSDGLKGLPEATAAAFPNAEFQRCIVHMIRNTMAYVSYKERKELASDLKLIYGAGTEEQAYENLMELHEKWSKRNIKLDNWVNNWENVSTFFKYGSELRKIIYTTNSIESLNNSYKRINKGRRAFPTIQSLEKSIYLATEIITEKWTQPYRNWGVIKNELKIFFENRI
jgi:putative transposase